MNKQEAKKRIAKLKKVINYHRYLYHVLDKQEIPDSAFDSLKHELYQLEEQFPDLKTLDSPTQRVGGEPLSEFKKVTHKKPMLSIEDVFEREELEQWQRYLKRLIPNKDFNYFCELKIDGFAISLVYQKGILKRAATRGNGRVGEDVTQNIKTIQSIPLKIYAFDAKDKEKVEKVIKGSLEIRGEVYMEKKAFDEINKKKVEQEEKIYANPRNLAAGSIRQLDPKLAASRNLKFLAYDIVSNIGVQFHSQKHQWLKKLGFKAEDGKICKSLDEVEDFWKKAIKKREQLPYQVDGVVITVNNNDLFNGLGVAGKSPRGVRAFKFAAKQATSVVKDIKIQVGRTGAITPVAILKPVNIEGSTITRATLHNKDQIERLGIKIGDTVIIERAGDVIPAVSKVLKDLRTGKEKDFKFPSKCPVCKTNLIKPKREVVFRCPNVNCSARKTEFLEHFVSKKAFDIEGLGPKIIRQLVDEKLISNPIEIFELKKGDLIPLERFAEKSASNLIKEIEESKKIPLSRFIYSLGIRHIGEETAIALSERFKDVELLKKVRPEELEAIEDIGQKVSKSIYNWFHNKKNLEFLFQLKERGIVILKPKRKENVFHGQTFLFTGSLKNISRDKAHKTLREKGANPVTSISKNTNYLVVGKNPGEKLRRAKELGVKIINEQEFLKMIK